MLSKTFCRPSPTTKAAAHSRAATADLNNAIDQLTHLLTLDTPARDPVTNTTSLPHRSTTDHINSCIAALTSLKARLERHALLLTQISHAGTQVVQTPRTTALRTSDIEANTLRVHTQLAQVIEQKEALMRHLLVVRHQLEETDSSSDSERPSLEIAPPRYARSPDHSVIATKTNTFPIADLSTISANPTTAPSTRCQLPCAANPKWDDSLDDDDNDI